MAPLAVSTGVAIAYAVVLLGVLIVAPATITALKGQWALFIAGYGATVSDDDISRPMTREKAT